MAAYNLLLAGEAVPGMRIGWRGGRNEFGPYNILGISSTLIGLAAIPLMMRPGTPYNILGISGTLIGSSFWLFSQRA